VKSYELGTSFGHFAIGDRFVEAPGPNKIEPIEQKPN